MELARTVRVRGLPADIADDRLNDKLLIHFLRSKNGGGEIEHVSFDKQEPGSALITFEDSLVAQRVARLPWHLLDVDGRKLEISVSQHYGRLDPDQVIINVSATVDFSQLPGGKAVLTSLHQRHPDIQTIYDPTRTTCIVCGALSKVQLVLAHLLGCCQSHNSLTPTRQKKELPQPQEHSFKELKEKRTNDYNSRLSDERHKKAPLDEKTTGGLSNVVEVSIIVDSDMFQYLQKRCQDQYHEILRQHRVEVVDVTAQGLTTLFLHVADPDQGQEQERIQMAQDAISKLYQENEIRIRKDQLCKSILSPKGGLKRALKNISLKFPRILLTEDDVNVYIIGNRSDVCDAKQILLLDQEEEDSLFPHPTEAVSPPVIDVQKTVIDKKGHQSGEEERRSNSKYKLATRFKDSGLSALTRLPGEFPFSTRQNHSLKDIKSLPVVQADSPEFRPAMKRTSSFSGTHQRKPQSKAPVSQDDSALSVSKSKVQLPSFTRQKDNVTREAYHADIIASNILWGYIKEAYNSDVEDLTTDVQVKESSLEDSNNVTLKISGANETKVIICQTALQALIDTVSPDFGHLEIQLGISNPTEEILNACCDEVRRRFSKVVIRMLKNKLLLLGPKRLCSQVGASLQEVFRADEGPEFNGKATGFTLSSSNTQLSVRKDPVVKEKMKSLGTSEHIFSQAYPSTTELKGAGLHQESMDGTSGHVGDGHNRPQTITNTFAFAQGDPVCICVCGKTKSPMTRTDCGTLMCSTCLETVHIHCRVCPGVEETQRGIQGTMSHSKVNVSIPGSKYLAIKVTYCIPNGIQGDTHPSPGEPFHGAVFEAYLPDCGKSRRLLQRLAIAFRQGLTFTVTSKDNDARVTWASIPHKTSLQGGKSGKGYPDSGYLTRLSDVLTLLGIEE